MILSIFSGNDVQAARRWVSEFHPVVAIFGGVRLDLRDALFAEGTDNLSALALFGSVEIYVPEHVGVYVEGASLFGGRELFDQKEGGLFAVGDVESPNYRSAAQHLNVTAIAIFGSVTVKRAPAVVATQA